MRAKEGEVLAAVMGVWKFAPMKENGRIVEPAGEVTISADAYKVTTPNGTETTRLRNGSGSLVQTGPMDAGMVQFYTNATDKAGQMLILHLRVSKDYRTLFVKWLTIYQGGGFGPGDFDSKLIRK